MDYETLARRYIREHRPLQRRWLRYYKRMPSLRRAVENAALARGPGGPKFTHQHRIPPAVLARARRNLLAVQRDMRRCTSFDRLHTFVDGRIGRIFGIGELTVYDTAWRIGAFLGLLPRKVYLHGGSRAGYIAVWGDPGAKALPKRRFPKSFQQLRAYEIEDLLCTFKDVLAGNATQDEIVSCYSPPQRQR